MLDMSTGMNDVILAASPPVVHLLKFISAGQRGGRHGGRMVATLVLSVKTQLFMIDQTMTQG